MLAKKFATYLQIDGFTGLVVHDVTVLFAVDRALVEGHDVLCQRARLVTEQNGLGFYILMVGISLIHDPQEIIKFT